MKLTKSKLREIVRQELKEISGTTGGKAAIQRQQKAKADVKTKKSDKTSKKSTWDTKKSTFDTKKSRFTVKDSEYTEKSRRVTTHAATEPDRYRYRQGDNPRGTWYTNASDPSRKYPNTSETNPAWSTWNTEKASRERTRDSALSDRNTARSEKETAETERDSAETDYEKAVKSLSDAEKAEMATKAATGFGFGAGGGGRAGGKGGTAKGKGKKGGKKDESLFRILGRDFITELNDLKKYSKLFYM